VTVIPNFNNSFIFIPILLGFERKARLFCDSSVSGLSEEKEIVRELGFERKARLFCDEYKFYSTILLIYDCWDLSVRLGYFVTEMK